MNENHDQTKNAGAGTTVAIETPRLRLVVADRTSVAPPSKARWAASEFACPTRLGVVRRTKAAGAGQLDNDKRRRNDRHEGKTMNRMESFISGLSRFVFGLGIGLALTSTYVIVSSGPDLLRTTDAAEVVHLDPVEVRISAKRFAEIRAEDDAPTRSVHVYGKGPQAA